MFIKNKDKSALIVSLFLVLFFSFRHIHKIIDFFELESSLYLMITLSLIFIIISYFIIKTDRNLENIVKILNVIIITMILLSLFNMLNGFIKIKGYRSGWDRLQKESDNKAQKELDISELPNIYYIIADAYGRDDMLKEVYGYDNSDFIKYLEKKGFYVAGKSTSNYTKTILSLGSSLNLNYLDNIVSIVGKYSQDQSVVINTIKGNKVAKLLKQYGYNFVVISSGYAETQITNADIYIKCQPIEDFELMLIQITPLYELLDKTVPIEEIYRNQALGAFEALKETAIMKSPNFIFIHIQGTHPPYVFGENGEKLTPKDFTSVQDYHFQGYKKQITYINKKLKEAINEIIDKSSKTSCYYPSGRSWVRL